MQQGKAYVLGIRATQPKDFPKKGGDYEHPAKGVFLSVLQLFPSGSCKVNEKRRPKQKEETN